VILNGYEIWFVLKDEYRLTVIETWVLRRTFGTKGEEVTGGLKKINEELYNLFSSPNI
jgi:hypothetical protein